MKISVRVITNAKQEKIETLVDGSYKVWLRAKPVGGEANGRLTSVLAEYFGLPKSKIKITLGQTSKNKLVEIVDV